MSYGLDLDGVPVVTRWEAPRDAYLVVPDPGTGSSTIVMHPFQWITLTSPVLDALDQIMRVLVARACNALDRIDLGAEPEGCP